jgi:hypothetical protein
VSKVGLSSVQTLLAPLIEIMACAYPPFNLWSVADISTFLDCLDIVMKYLSCLCNSNLIFGLLGNVCTSFLALWRVLSRMIEDGYIGSNYSGFSFLPPRV